jgi:hypothetical protein
MISAMQVIHRYQEGIEPWLAVEIASKASSWLEDLESLHGRGVSVGLLTQLLPSLYRIFQTPDAEQRTARLRQKAIQVLLSARQFRETLALLDLLGETQPPVRAACLEGLGDFPAAAELFREAGELGNALRNYRAIPDLDKALQLVTKLKDHPAAESLQWIRRMQELAAQRPADLPKVVTSKEMQYLQDILERSLGVTRKVRKPRQPAKPKAPSTGVPRKPGRPRRLPRPRTF